MPEKSEMAGHRDSVPDSKDPGVKPSRSRPVTPFRSRGPNTLWREDARAEDGPHLRVEDRSADSLRVPLAKVLSIALFTLVGLSVAGSGVIGLVARAKVPNPPGKGQVVAATFRVIVGVAFLTVVLGDLHW
jgi:hypothetical protein